MPVFWPFALALTHLELSHFPPQPSEVLADPWGVQSAREKSLCANFFFSLQPRFVGPQKKVFIPLDPGGSAAQLGLAG